MPSFIFIRPTSVWPQYTNVTDSQTDMTERTDRQDRATVRQHSANRFTNARPKNGSPYAIRPLSCLSCPVLLSCPVCDFGVLWPNGWMGQDTIWYGGRPQLTPHCARWGHSSHRKRGTAAPHFRNLRHSFCLRPYNPRPCPLWPNGSMDQDAIWYGGRPRPWRHCVRWGSSSPKKGAQPPFWPMFIVSKWSPISTTAEHLLE